MTAKNARVIANGMAILNDFDSTTYVMRPATKQKMAVRVPERNIPHVTSTAVNAKEESCPLDFCGYGDNEKVTAVPAALHP